ncbi:MAG: recombinase family protein [Conexivisphaerales archaeon]
MTLAFTYVRAGIIEDVRQGSNERKKEQIRQHIESKCYDLGFFEDRAKSGQNVQRPEFERALKFLDRKPQIVIVSKVDRFTRSLSDLLKMFEYFDQNGIGPVSANDPGIDTTTPNGRLMLQIPGAFAESERNMINSCTKEGREQLNKRIKFSKPPFEFRVPGFESSTAPPIIEFIM